MEKLLSVKDVSELLNISSNLIRKMSKDKTLPAYKIGKSWRFKESEVKKFISNCANQTA